MKYRNPSPTPHKWEILGGLIIGLGLFVWADHTFSADLGYNPEGATIADKPMEQAIRYALWQHASRYKVDTAYTGMTGEILADGKIIIQWEHLGLFDERLGFARWWNRVSDDGLVRAVIVINADQSPTVVDACMRELLVHELGHIFRGKEGHSGDPRDVMYPLRGDCRYSLSLGDLQFIGKPLTSCHVELTPDGGLEALDYTGKRISLAPLVPGIWRWESLYENPQAQYCNGIVIDGSIIWAEVKGFEQPTSVYRIENNQGLFTLKGKY